MQRARQAAITLHARIHGWSISFFLFFFFISAIYVARRPLEQTIDAPMRVRANRRTINTWCFVVTTYLRRSKVVGISHLCVRAN